MECGIHKNSKSHNHNAHCIFLKQNEIPKMNANDFLPPLAHVSLSTYFFASARVPSGRAGSNWEQHKASTSSAFSASRRPVALHVRTQHGNPPHENGLRKRGDTWRERSFAFGSSGPNITTFTVPQGKTVPAQRGTLLLEVVVRAPRHAATWHV